MLTGGLWYAEIVLTKQNKINCCLKKSEAKMNKWNGRHCHSCAGWLKLM